MDEFTKRKISVYGINGCLDALKSDLVEINQIYIGKESSASKHKEIESLYSNLPTDKTLFLDEDSFSKKVGTNRAQGILIKAQVSIAQALPMPKHDNECCVILDRVQDPHNLGQILRICAGGKIDGVIITDKSSVSITSAVAQVSQGGFAKIPIYEITNISQTILHFKEHDYWITSFENNINAQNWYSIDLKGRTVLIFGGEGSGISKKVLENSDFTATIPMSNEMNSLNVSSAVSAIVFERLRQISI